MKTKTTFLLLGLILGLTTLLNAQNKNETWQIKWDNPKSFIENNGQFKLYQSNEKVLFAYDNGSTMIYFTKKGVRYSFLKRWPATDKDEQVLEEGTKENSAEAWEEKEEAKNKMDFETDVAGFDWLNASNEVQVMGSEETNDYHSYPIKQQDGTDKTINFIKGYKKIIYKNIYPAIDVEFEFHPVEGIRYSVILHKGADFSKFKMLYSKNITINYEGNIIIPTKFGDITEHAPLSFYAGNKENIIKSGFTKDRNIISFNLEGYNNSQEVIIDPWIQTPTLTNSNGVWECERDALGNVYIIGGDMPMKLQKYNSAGALQWTYNTPWDTASYWLGTLATDLQGNSYITAGSIADLKKINTTNNVVWSYSAPAHSANEFWDIAFNCDQTKLIVGGTKGNMTQLQGAIFKINSNNGNIIDTIDVGWGNMLGIPPSINEVRSITSSSNSRVYFLTLDTIGSISENFNSSSQPFFRINSTYNLAYKCEYYRPNNGNAGIKAIKANGNFVYTQNGAYVHKRSLSTGAILATVNIPGGNSTSTMGQNQVGNSGIDIDSCGNVYVGSSNKVIKYDANLNILDTVNTTYTVSDVAVSTGGNVIICGTTGTNSSMNRTGYVQSLNMSACKPMPLYCCNANVYPAGPFCIDNAPVTLIPDQSGGTWSGTGVNPTTGVFNPAVAGIGTHTIIYTLACGSSSTVIKVDSCPKVCKDTIGNIFVSGGTAPYSWQEWAPADTTPITNQTECTACGYTWNSLVNQCLNGMSPATSCNNPPHWSTFATGSFLPPSAQFPLRVIDTNGRSVIIDSLGSLSYCGQCETVYLTITNITNAGCLGSSNGSFSASVSGGIPPYKLTLKLAGNTIAFYNNVTSMQTFTGLAAGNYTLNIIDNDSCMKSTAIIISVNPLPGPAGNISGPSVVNQGQTGVSYSVPIISNATSYVWTFPQGVTIVSGNNTNSIVVNFSANSASGIITVYGNNSCGYGVSSPVFPVTILTGIDNVPPFVINFYPNPTNGTITIEMNNNPNEPLTMNVYNIIGELIFKTPLANEHQQSFNFKGFANGIYYLKISGTKFNKIEKLIIQKID